MNGETDLQVILQNLKPKLNEGEYVFCAVDETQRVDLKEVQMIFKEQEAITLVLRKEVANRLNLKYDFVAAWITLDIHTALEGVGLTAVFSKALADANISANVVAAFYHDHVFINKKDEQMAMTILKRLSECKI
ncbi:MAG: ACT domain-containing protein [Spirosomataceae bacterium]